MPSLPCPPKLLALPAVLALSSVAFAQDVEPTEATLPDVVVSDTAASDEIGRKASVGGFSEAPLRETPASISVITQQQMQERGIRSATEAGKYDASVQNSYNAVGLSDRLAIRGFELDYGSSFRKDGLVILGTSPVALENKEQIEILKGLAGLQAGIASSGGILNYVTKRPTDVPLRTVTLETSERGTLYGAVDLGGRTDDGRFGYRINAAASKVRSYVRGSNGERQFVSGAFDWRLSDRALLQFDLDRMHKSQLSVPGFQLLGGNTVPKNVSARDMLNNQPWSSPVVDDTTNYGLKFSYDLNDDWRTELSVNHHTLRRDDAVALPANFQSNGDYTVVDLRRDNDKRTVLSTQALLKGKVSTGSVRHELTFGAATMNRRDSFADYVFDPRGTSNIYDPVDVAPSPLPNNPVSLRRKDAERAVFVQDVLHLSEQFKLHAGLRYVTLDRDQFNAAGTLLRRTSDNFVLPNLALVYSPNKTLSFYGSLSRGLEPGGTAPVGSTNSGQVLDPSKSRQVELGVKADLAPDLSVAAAVFQLQRPYEYLPGVGEAFQASGTDRRRGLELSANGRVTRDLLIGASLTLTLADVQGDATESSRRVGNVSRYKSIVYGEYTVPSMPALRLNGSWQYGSSKLFAPAGTILTKVSGYHVVNVGASYLTEIGGTPTTFRFGVNNLFDEFYWGDTSNTLGGYLIPGAPRTLRLTAQFDF